jgi:hypothetical protein
MPRLLRRGAAGLPRRRLRGREPIASRQGLLDRSREHAHGAGIEIRSPPPRDPTDVLDALRLSRREPDGHEVLEARDGCSDPSRLLREQGDLRPFGASCSSVAARIGVPRITANTMAAY